MYIAVVRWQHRFESSEKKKKQRIISVQKNVDVVFKEFLSLLFHLLRHPQYWRVNITNFDWKNKFLPKKSIHRTQTAVQLHSDIRFPLNPSSACLAKRKMHERKTMEKVQHQTAYAIGVATRAQI